jgi:hypothetical protein
MGWQFIRVMKFVEGAFKRVIVEEHSGDMMGKIRRFCVHNVEVCFAHPHVELTESAIRLEAKAEARFRRFLV